MSLRLYIQAVHPGESLRACSARECIPLDDVPKRYPPRSALHLRCIQSNDINTTWESATKAKTLKQWLALDHAGREALVLMTLATQGAQRTSAASVSACSR